MNKETLFKSFLVILGVLILFFAFFSEGEKRFGAVDIPVNLQGTSTLVSVTSTFGGGSGLRFPARSQVAVRQFYNNCGFPIFLSFATSGPLTEGQGGFRIAATSSLEMTLENGLLHRGDVYASSTGDCPSGLRLFQY